MEETIVPPVIAPHPGLTPAQAPARAIAIDYGLRGGNGSRWVGAGLKSGIKCATSSR
jgi:hypothetical protein